MRLQKQISATGKITDECGLLQHKLGCMQKLMFRSCAVMFSWYANVQRDLKYYFKALDREPAVRARSLARQEVNSGFFLPRLKKEN